MKQITTYDVIIIGAGAAGLMCAIRAGERSLSVLLLEKSNKIGSKILISGGGRCNFTNLDINPSAYLSPNSHFCKSALSRYTQWHFIELLSQQGLTYHEKTLGQLFCEQKSAAVVTMLVNLAKQQGVTIHLDTHVDRITQDSQQHYHIQSAAMTYSGKQLVVATGGPSIPKIGASDFALRVAKQFAIKNTPFSPALVPLTVDTMWLNRCKALAGVSQFVEITCQNQSFTENLLFTHRGLSGPAILQISSYWKKGEALQINLCPTENIYAYLHAAKQQQPKQLLSKCLAGLFANKLAAAITDWYFTDQPLQAFSDKALAAIAEQLQNWQITPTGTEGMKKAEVSLGGVHPDALSSKTFETHRQKGLYFIGEAVDVTGWLGGYNFQWAWSSGWCCGDAL